MTTISGKPESAGFGKLLELQGEAKEEAPPAKEPVAGGAKVFTMAEIAKHNTEHDK